VRPKTVKGYEAALASILAELGEDTHAQRLTRRQVESAVDAMRTVGGVKGEGLSQRSIVLALGALKMVLRYGVDTGLLSSNVAESVKPPRKSLADHRDVTIWTPEELLTFRAVADGDEWGALIRLSLCGLRRSEVLGLPWESIDLDAGTLVVTQGRTMTDGVNLVDMPKSKASGRVVPFESIAPGTAAMLKALRRRQAAERLAHGSAYTNPLGLVAVDAVGRPINPDVYGKRIRELMKRAKVPTIRLHDVRHSVATMMHRAGVAPSDAAVLMGHSLQVHIATYITGTGTGAATAATALGKVLAQAQ
jgi:integrase